VAVVKLTMRESMWAGGGKDWPKNAIQHDVLGYGREARIRQKVVGGTWSIEIRDVKTGEWPEHSGGYRGASMALAALKAEKGEAPASWRR
jgi:hypothetical protein